MLDGDLDEQLWSRKVLKIYKIMLKMEANRNQFPFMTEFFRPLVNRLQEQAGDNSVVSSGYTSMSGLDGYTMQSNRCYSP